MASANQSIIIALATTDFLCGGIYNGRSQREKPPPVPGHGRGGHHHCSGGSKYLPFCPTAAMAPRGGAVVQKVGREQSIPNIWEDWPGLWPRDWLGTRVNCCWSGLTTALFANAFLCFHINKASLVATGQSCFKTKTFWGLTCFMARNLHISRCIFCNNLLIQDSQKYLSQVGCPIKWIIHPLRIFSIQILPFCLIPRLPKFTHLRDVPSCYGSVSSQKKFVKQVNCRCDCELACCRRGQGRAPMKPANGIMLGKWRSKLLG